MKITQVTYGQTVNTGNYSSMRLEATAEVDEGDDAAFVMAELRAFIRLQATDPAKGAS